jgi:6-phosphogluconolactonase
MKKIILLSFLLTPVLVVFAQNNYLLIGTYKSEKKEGISVFKFNYNTGVTEKVSEVNSYNSSYMCLSPNKKYVYVNNQFDNDFKGGAVSSYSFDNKTGQLSLVNQQPTEGDDPCYLAIDKTGKWLAVANYQGSIAIFPVSDNGTIEKPRLTQHTGSSIDTARQKSAHPHNVYFSPDNKFLYSADLGMDKTKIYHFNEKDGSIASTKQDFVKVTAGSGPRHFIVDSKNKFTYLICELNGNVQVCKKQGEKLIEIQNISISKDSLKMPQASADIHLSPDGKFLYCSNRGELNTITIFSVNKKTGKLTLIENVSTKGIRPRNFCIDPTGNFLLVANQKSNEVIIFKRNKTTGLLTDSGNKIEIQTPVHLRIITE